MDGNILDDEFGKEKEKNKLDYKRLVLGIFVSLFLQMLTWIILRLVSNETTVLSMDLIKLEGVNYKLDILSVLIWGGTFLISVVFSIVSRVRKQPLFKSFWAVLFISIMNVFELLLHTGIGLDKQSFNYIFTILLNDWMFFFLLSSSQFFVFVGTILLWRREAVWLGFSLLLVTLFGMGFVM